MKNKLIVALCFIFAFANLGVSAVYAASEAETSAAYLAESGIFEGSLDLGQPLTRAELAVILTRLDFAEAPDGLAEWSNWGMAHFADPENRYNSFTDLSDWALPYVEYCYERSLIKGVSDTQFSPEGAVDPQTACAAILRQRGIPETDGDHSTSLLKAQSLGIAPAGEMDEVISRGTMAVIILRAMNYEAPYAAAETPILALPVQIAFAPNELPAKDEAPAMTINEMKAEIVRLTNKERARIGLPALRVLPELMDSAQLKVQDMLDNHYIGHHSPKYGSANDMIKALVPGYKGASENFNIGGTTAAEVMESWITSEGHYKNLTSSRATCIGVGIARNSNGALIWVQQMMIK
jgi:uncharacterized protein YkwD